MKVLLRLFAIAFFFITPLSFAATDLPKVLTKKAAWLSVTSPTVTLACPIHTKDGKTAEHTLTLFNKREKEMAEMIEIQSLNGTPYLVVHWASSPKHPGYVIWEFAFFVRQSNGKWSAHVSSPGKLVARSEINVFAQREYLSAHHMTLDDIKNCVRDGNEY
jgi:hypothetical protein